MSRFHQITEMLSKCLKFIQKMIWNRPASFTSSRTQYGTFAISRHKINTISHDCTSTLKNTFEPNEYDTKRYLDFELDNFFYDNIYTFENVKTTFSELQNFEIDHLKLILEIFRLLYHENGISDEVIKLIDENRNLLEKDDLIFRLFQKLQKGYFIENEKDFYLYIWFYIKDLISSKALTFIMKSKFEQSYSSPV